MMFKTKIRVSRPLYQSAKNELLMKLLTTPLLILLFQNTVTSDLAYFMGSSSNDTPILAILVRVSIIMFTLIWLYRMLKVLASLSQYLTVRIGSVEDFKKISLLSLLSIMLLIVVYDSVIIKIMYQAPFFFEGLLYTIVIYLSLSIFIVINVYELTIKEKTISLALYLLLSVASGILPIPWQFSIYTANLTILYESNQFVMLMIIHCVIRVVILLVLKYKIKTMFKGGLK